MNKCTKFKQLTLVSHCLLQIVEPEVTLGPGAYTIEETAYWSERVYSHVMRLLNEYDVLLEGILLKPNMCVTPS